MESPETLQRLALALLMGLLVGLQRERASRARIAGIRTFGLITLLGGVCGALVDRVGSWAVVGGLIAVTALIVMSNRGAPLIDHDEATPATRPPGPGVTTEAAMLLMFGVGALLMLAPISIGVCVGGATAILLHLKPQLHGFVRRLDEREFRAIMQFALVSAVILPALPDEAYDKWGALNPRHIWLMVTLITGMSLAGYLAHRFIGARRGAIVAGALGGLISSTATTVSFGRQGARPGGAALAAAVIGIACAIMYARVGIEIGAVAPAMLAAAWAPLGSMAAATALGAGLAWARAGRAEGAPAQEHGNPAELRAALIFGGTYALIAIGAAAAKEYLGESALFGVAAASGATEMDAITLSIARMADGGALEPGGAWRYIVVAAMANTVFKWIIAAALGGRSVAVALAPAFAGSLGVGALWLVLAT